MASWARTPGIAGLGGLGRWCQTGLGRARPPAAEGLPQLSAAAGSRQLAMASSTGQGPQLHHPQAGQGITRGGGDVSPIG